MSKPFDRDEVKEGDRLVLARDEAIGLRFKFLGFRGDVVATWEVRPADRPRDAILRQKDVRIPEVS